MVIEGRYFGVLIIIGLLSQRATYITLMGWMDSMAPRAINWTIVHSCLRPTPHFFLFFVSSFLVIVPFVSVDEIILLSTFSSGKIKPDSCYYGHHCWYIEIPFFWTLDWPVPTSYWFLFSLLARLDLWYSTHVKVCMGLLECLLIYTSYWHIQVIKNIYTFKNKEKFKGRARPDTIQARPSNFEVLQNPV